MTCANIGITILSIFIAVLALWPGIAGATWAAWAIIIAAVLTIVIVWTGCKCAYCDNLPKSKKK